MSSKIRNISVHATGENSNPKRTGYVIELLFSVTDSIVKNFIRIISVRITRKEGRHLSGRKEKATGTGVLSFFKRLIWERRRSYEEDNCFYLGILLTDNSGINRLCYGHYCRGHSNADHGLVLL
jgi:hypothetical protein